MSVMLVTEKMTAYGSFCGSHGGHTGIGTGPIALFGTEEQKAKYLPKFGTGRTAFLLRVDRSRFRPLTRWRQKQQPY